MNRKLTQSDIGKRCSCVLRGEIVADAKIQYDGRTFFICQNIANGACAENRFGYKYSWSVGGGEENMVRLLKINIYEPDLKLDDIDNNIDLEGK